MPMPKRNIDMSQVEFEYIFDCPMNSVHKPNIYARNSCYTVKYT